MECYCCVKTYPAQISIINRGKRQEESGCYQSYLARGFCNASSRFPTEIEQVEEEKIEASPE